MIIDLPSKFQMKSEDHKYAFSEVRDGILHLYGNISFRRVIYNITYILKGESSCYYCGRRIRPKNMTLDHMYSVDMGGPTIPNNLIPCCSKCNEEKSNMSIDSYRVYMGLRANQRQTFRKLVIKEQELIRKSGCYEIPEDWIELSPIDKFIVQVDMLQKCKTRKYRQMKAYHKKYNMLKTPVIVDKNNFVLDGYMSLMFAKSQGIKSVPVIKLENVWYHI